MDERPTWTDCDEAGDNVVPYVLSPRDLVSRPDNMDETVSHTIFQLLLCMFRETKGNVEFDKIKRKISILESSCG